MECDDLKPPICKYVKKHPTFPAREAHIIMWEKQSADSGYVLRHMAQASPNLVKTCDKSPITSVAAVPKTVPVTANPMQNSVLSRNANVQTPTQTSICAQIPVVSENVATAIPKPDAAAVAMMDPVAERLRRMKEKFMAKKGPSHLNFISLPIKNNIPLPAPLPNGNGISSSVIPTSNSFTLTRMPASSTVGRLDMGVQSQRLTAQSRQLSSVVTARWSTGCLVPKTSYLSTLLPMLRSSRPYGTQRPAFERYVPKSRQNSLDADSTAAASNGEQANCYDESQLGRRQKVCFSLGDSEDTIVCMGHEKPTSNKTTEPVLEQSKSMTTQHLSFKPKSQPPDLGSCQLGSQQLNLTAQQLQSTCSWMNSPVLIHSPPPSKSVDVKPSIQPSQSDVRYDHRVNVTANGGNLISTALLDQSTSLETILNYEPVDFQDLMTMCNNTETDLLMPYDNNFAENYLESLAPFVNGHRLGRSCASDYSNGIFANTEEFMHIPVPVQNVSFEGALPEWLSQIN